MPVASLLSPKRPLQTGWRERCRTGRKYCRFHCHRLQARTKLSSSLKRRVILVCRSSVVTSFGKSMRRALHQLEICTRPRLRQYLQPVATPSSSHFTLSACLRQLCNPNGKSKRVHDVHVVLTFTPAATCRLHLIPTLECRSGSALLIEHTVPSSQPRDCREAKAYYNGEVQLTPPSQEHPLLKHHCPGRRTAHRKSEWRFFCSARRAATHTRRAEKRFCDVADLEHTSFSGTRSE